MLIAFSPIMQIGVSTWLWTSPFNSDSMDLLIKIKEMGFDFVEIPIEEPNHLNNSALFDTLKRLNLEVTLCGAFSPGRNLASPNSQIIDNTLDYIKNCLSIAANINSEIFVGPMYSEVGKIPASNGIDRRIELDRCIKNLKTVSTMAEDYGVQLAVEPLNRFESDLVNTAQDLKSVIERVGSPMLKGCLDSFHMNIEEADFENAVNILRENLIHVQVSESHRGIPGTGNSDWAGLYRGLSNINYAKKISLESFTPQNQSLANAVCIWKKFAETQDEFALRGLKFLKNLFTQEQPYKNKTSLAEV